MGDPWLLYATYLLYASLTRSKEAFSGISRMASVAQIELVKAFQLCSGKRV